MKRILLAAFGLLLLSIPVQAQPTSWGYSDNFDAYNASYTLSNWIKQADGTYTQDGGLTSQASLSSADLAAPHAWVTTDALQDDGLATEWGSYAGDKWAVIGGFGAPSATSTELWSPVKTPFEYFSVNFGITASSIGQPTNDIFKWTVRDTAGNKLFAITFKYYDATTYAMYLESATGTQTPLSAGPGLLEAINLGSIYALSFTTDLQNHSYSGTITPLSSLSAPLDPVAYPPFSFGAINLPDATDIGAVAATYVLSDPQLDGSGNPTNYGDNLMIFNNYQAIPEPSTLALVIGGLGLLTAVQRRRNRTS